MRRQQALAAKEAGKAARKAAAAAGADADAQASHGVPRKRMGRRCNPESTPTRKLVLTCVVSGLGVAKAEMVWHRADADAQDEAEKRASEPPVAAAAGEFASPHFLRVRRLRLTFSVRFRARRPGSCVWVGARSAMRRSRRARRQRERICIHSCMQPEADPQSYAF